MLMERASGAIPNETLSRESNLLLDKFALAHNSGLIGYGLEPIYYWFCDVENRSHEMVTKAQLRLPGARLAVLTSRGAKTTHYGENIPLPDLSSGESVNLLIWCTEHRVHAQPVVLLTKGKATLVTKGMAPNGLVELWRGWVVLRTPLLYALVAMVIIALLGWLITGLTGSPT
jgi:hypothetical protein